MTSLTLTLAPATLTADTESRRITGTLVPYDTPGRTSLGDITVTAGAIRVPDPINRVRLLYGHDRNVPIGVAVALEDTPAGLVGTFAVARTPQGDTYLAEMDPETPIRDGLSIELDNVTLNAAQNTVTAGDLVAVAAVPLPAYPTARAALAAEHTPEEGVTPMTDPATVTAAAPAAVPDPAPVALEASTVPARAMTAPAPARTAPVSAVAEMAARLCAARLEGQTSMRAALADITPAGNGPGNAEAGMMRQALGELWSGVDYAAKYRPLIGAGELTGTKVSGFRWDPPPTVADYAGNKSDVPSNPAKLEFVETAPTRLAGAHDIDRIYRDLGDPAVLASYWRQMSNSLAVQLDAKGLDLIVEAAGAGVAAAGVMAALVRGTLAVSEYGTATFALVSADLIEAMSLTKQVDAPVGPPMALPPVTAAPDLPNGTVIVGTRPAARLLTFNPPIRVEAVNIPNGGIDAGLFSYAGGIVELAAGIVRYTVPPATRDAASK